MKIKTDNLSISVCKAWDLQANWSKTAILQMLEHEDFDEHPRVKLCNEYISDINLLPPKKGERNS